MSRYWLGCCGWAYDDWVGPFYPPGTPLGEFLERYGRVFRTVEVDASFYRAPSPAQIDRWVERTPGGFRFSLKVPRTVTHDPPSGSGTDLLEEFVRSVAPVRDAGKLGAVVLQFPPSFRRPRDADRFDALLGAVDRSVPLAVELRHGSWWVPETRRALEERRASLVWSVSPATDPPAWVTGEFVYCRFVGDRALQRFDRVQRDGRPDLERMGRRFVEDTAGASEVFAYSNNHFMGFGPETVVELARTLGEPVPDLGRAMRSPGQNSLDGA